jgi:hypothetical protein
MENLQLPVSIHTVSALFSMFFGSFPGKFFGGAKA